MRKNQKGFSLVEGLIVFVIVGLISFVGWYVWQSRQDTTKKTNNENASETSNSQTNEVAKTTSIISLAQDKVTFEAPKDWTKDGIGCVQNSNKYGEQEYLDSVALLPGEKLRTIYGDGTEFFHINVCVFTNDKNLSPEVWFTDASSGGIGEGTGSANDLNSNQPINDSPAYYRKSMPGEYEEIHYVISAKDKIVYVTARTYDTDKDLPGVGDFRKFETPIKDLVDSIKVQ